MASAISFTIEPFGERGWLAWFEGLADDVASGLFANAVAHAIRAAPGITDAVAGIDSVTIRFDMAAMSSDNAKRTLTEVIEQTPPQQQAAASTPIDIPVCYGGAHGPDFDDLCKRNLLTPAEVIATHSSTSYRVITLGFAPGFAYLGPLDKRLQAPRLDTPRQRVDAGSVGVAGVFTGVYALPSPGGWRIIGRTPLPLFDVKSGAPFLFRPGAVVRFRPVNESEFNAIREQIK